MPNIELLNCDCMSYMATLPDKSFDLAIVDPPYGLGIDGQKGNVKKGVQIRKAHSFKGWDNAIPTAEYFAELKRVSKNQIIWGGNYFLDYLGKTDGFVVWDKMNGTNPMADAELAWQNIKGTTRMFRWHHFSGERTTKIHPTQKPIQLYEWLLHNYAKPNDKILDTHLGSGSIAIACHNLGFDLTACELDKEYFDSAMKRIEQHKSQIRMF